MGLRDRAAELDVRPETSVIGKLIAEADDDLKAEITDLLFGEPRVRHTIVARVLTEATGVPIGSKQVETYRKRPR